MVKDLTFQQLSDAISAVYGQQAAQSIVLSETDGIIIKVNKICGENYASMSSQGVVELMFKLREACAAAQIVANQGKAVGERLGTFPPATYGGASSVGVRITQNTILQTPLNTNNPMGVNL